MRGRRLRALPILAGLLSLTGCLTLPGARPQPERLEPVPAAPREPGRLEYEQAKDAVLAGNHRRAVELLAAAAGKDATVCEYWYQLGAAEANLAIDVVYDSDSEAVRLFESSIDHKREALRLMDLGRCAIWTEPQERQARYDAEMGLRDADVVLRDKTALVIALRMYADQRAVTSR